MARGHAPSPAATSKQHLRHAHAIVDTLFNLVRFTPCAKQQAATMQTWCKVPPAHSEPQSLALLHVATHGSYTSKTAFFVAAISTQPCQQYCQPFKYTTRCLSNYTQATGSQSCCFTYACAPSTALLGDPAGMSEGPACVTLHAATHTNCSEQQSLLTTLQNTSNKNTLTTPDWSLVQMSQVGKSAQSKCKTHTRLVTTTHTRNNRQTQSPAHTRFIVLSDTHTLSHKHTAMSAVWRPSSSPTNLFLQRIYSA